MTAISVVMGVYNAGVLLAPTLDSILAQTERDFECIVVDDGSTDASPQILADYAARDSRIRVITQQNAGLTRALITGCAAARGTYIARHDAGDLSHPRRFELQRALLDANRELAFVSCATQYTGPELEPLFVTSGTGLAMNPIRIIDLDRENGVADGPAHHGSVMFRRDCYERAGGYRPQFYYGQDWDLWYRLAEEGMFQILPEVLYTARITPDGISTASRETQHRIGMLSHKALLARARHESDAAILEEARQLRPVRRRGRRARAAGFYFIGEALRRNGDVRARRYLRQSIAAWPFSIPSWLRLVQSLRLKSKVRTASS
jgi:GT2 family glycosyltransferase